MILILYGPDKFRSSRKLNEIIEHYKKTNKKSLNLKYFDAETDNLEELFDWLKQSPMFREKKMVVLKNALKLYNHFKDFSKSDNILLFFDESQTLPELEGIKAQKFDFLSGVKLRDWVKKEFERFGLKVNSEVVDKMIKFIGSDSWRINNEIKKLACYCQNRNVSIRDIELLVKPKIETDIFKTVMHLAFKNKKQALDLIHKHLEKGDSPLYLLAMINWQFRRLITQSRNTFFNRQELKRIYHKILETDLNIKTGKLDPETALDLLISEI